MREKSAKSDNTEKKPLVKPNPKGGYDLSIRQAKKRLKKMDAADICKRCQANYSPQGGFSLPYLNYTLRVDPESYAVSFPDPERSLDSAFEVMTLHYLTDAQPAKPTHRWVSYRELPSGGFYYPVFRARAESPLSRELGSQPKLFERAARSLGGEPIEYGDLAFKVITFPRLPLAYILWAGGEEFPANASVLFDSSAEDHLSIEDLAHLGETVTKEFIRSAQRIY